MKISLTFKLFIYRLDKRISDLLPEVITEVQLERYWYMI